MRSNLFYTGDGRAVLYIYGDPAQKRATVTLTGSLGLIREHLRERDPTMQVAEFQVEALKPAHELTADLLAD